MSKQSSIPFKAAVVTFPLVLSLVDFTISAKLERFSALVQGCGTPLATTPKHLSQVLGRIFSFRSKPVFFRTPLLRPISHSWHEHGPVCLVLGGSFLRSS